jgi:uncharacterized protein HemY
LNPEPFDVLGAGVVVAKSSAGERGSTGTAVPQLSERCGVVMMMVMKMTMMMVMMMVLMGTFRSIGD